MWVIMSGGGCVRYKVIFLDRDNIDICLKAKELLKI